MEHGLKICGETIDMNYQRYVGWSENNLCVRKFYSPQTVKLISKKVTELTKGVDPKNRSIVVPDERIIEVMDGVYQGYTPPTGDIYTRYVVPNNEQHNMVQSLIDQTIEIITSNIRNTIGIEEYNKTLSTWVQVYGDFNTHGLRSHDIIKTQEKRPTPMQFNMNY